MSSGGHLLSRYHRHGDADAFCALVRDHAGMVFATAKRVVGDAALAEDVAQETFLELARKGHDAVESVAAWLHRVAWRKACNAVRGEARRRRREQAAAETFCATTEASWSDLEPLIDEALEELPPRLRECLVEHYLEGRTQQELEVRMGVNRSTVSRQLDVGVRTMRSLLCAKGVRCGAGLAAVLGTGSAQAAPLSLTASLGKLAISGMGAGSPGTASIAVGTTLLTMNISKIPLTIAAVAALVSVPVIVFHRTNTDEKTRPAAAPTKSPPSPPSSAKQTAKARPRAAEPLHYRPAPVSEDVRLKVDAIIRRHRGMTKEQMGQSEELASLAQSFMGEPDSPEMQRRMEGVYEAMQAVKGMKVGMVAMDMGGPDSPEFRAWLEAVVSGDRKQMQDWFLNRLEGAVFEFGLDPNLKRSSDGITVHPAPPVKPQADDKENDLAFVLPGLADEPTSKTEPVEGWGNTLNPAEDCKFRAEDGKLTITVPGSDKPHDLSPELTSSTAPRVVQPVEGDFIIQVRVDGDFQPGDDSTQLGRTGYTGAGLVVFADESNFVRIERATLHRQGGEAIPYINFEIRVNGELEKIGTTGNLPMEKDKPTWLRLERKGQQMIGGMSHDGENWTYGEPKELRAEAWNQNDIVAGVAAISTSRQPFAPIYSAFSIQQGSKPNTEKSDSK